MFEFHSRQYATLCGTEAGHSLHTSKPASATTSLTLPVFSNVRSSFYPAVQKITVHQIRFMAKVLLAIKPDYRMSWPAGISLEDIAVDILGGTEKELNVFEKKQGMATGKVFVYANEKDGLTVTINVVDIIMPIFYEDLKKVRNKAPELLPFFCEALRLLVAGHACISAEDVKWIGRDLYEGCILPDAESYDEANFEKEKKFYDRLLDSGPEGVFFDVTKKTFKRRYAAFKGAVAGLKVMSGYKEVCKKWLLKVVNCFDMKNFKVIRQTLDCTADCLSFEYAFPILWERDDAITEMFDRQVNESFDSGIDVIPAISFDLAWDQKKIQPDIKKLKEVIRTLAVMRDVFSFFEKGKKDSNGQHTIEV